MKLTLFFLLSYYYSTNFLFKVLLAHNSPTHFHYVTAAKAYQGLFDVFILDNKKTGDKAPV